MIGGIFYSLGLAGYKIYWKLALKFKTKFKDIKLPNLNRTFVHIFMIGLTLAVVTNNLQATVVSSNFGQNTLLYSIVGDSNSEGVITESVPAGNINKPVSYLASTDAVSATPQMESAKLGAPDLSSTASGGSALVKPTLGSEVLTPKNRLRNSIEEYTVQDGDTVAFIADEFGVTINTVLWENRLTVRSIIQPGQKLTILPTSGVSHVVKSGDSLQRIAKLYNVETNEI